MPGGVLIVDDDQLVLAWMRRILDGRSVFTARDAFDGLALATSEEPDVMIIDVHMPRQDGIALLSTLRARGVDAPAILISADPSWGQRHRSLLRRLDASFLPKEGLEDTLPPCLP